MKALKILGWLVLGIVVVGVLAAILDTPDANYFEVRRKDLLFKGDGLEMDIANVGKSAIAIKGIRINERSDCSVIRSFMLGAQDLKLPMKLEIGDQIRVRSSCRIIRSQIDTDKGSVTYSFQ